MHSLTNSKVLSRLSLLLPSVVLMCSPLTVRSELNVEWIDNNTIVVYGIGDGNITNETELGGCTNCLAISPDEMRAIKLQISDLLIDVETLASGCFGFAVQITNRISQSLNDISGFRRFGSYPATSRPTADQILQLTNYVQNVANTQTQLDKLHFVPFNNQGNILQNLSYNNGIYDYATSFVSPELSATFADATSILDSEEELLSKVRTINNVVNNITEESCDSCGGGSNGSSCGSCPCEEQWEALLDYIRHIDDDQHKRFHQLQAISNNVFNIYAKFDSYAKLVSGVLYQDGTITFEDGETWTNVYFSGRSEGYEYDKSNILQRIELILFGLAYHPTNTFSDLSDAYTNALDDTSVENVTNSFDDFSSSVSNGFDSAYKDFRAHVNSLKSIDSMFVFWGQAGSTSPFVLGQVPDLGGSGSPQYITVGNDFLGSEVPRFRMLCRYAFQLLWAVLFLFMIWEFYVRLFKYVVMFLKYVCEWLNECFAS